MVARAFLPSILGLPSIVAATLALAGCGQDKSPAPQESGAVAPATPGSTAPDAKPGIAASDARLVLPVIAGRPGAAYFTVRNQGPNAATLVGVHVSGAGKTEMHRTDGGSMAPVDKLEIAAGATLAFAPGALHAMVFDIDPKLKTGGASELTLTFSDGDKASVPLNVEAMGGGMKGHDMGDHDMGDMEGMQH
jgi:copper(I)-binding protein